MRASESPHPTPQDTDYAVEVDFERNSPNPERVFKSATGLIESVERLDKDLANTVDVHIEPLTILEDIQTSSLKVWLRSTLTSVDDTALIAGDWKGVVGKYLFRAKYALLEFLNDHPRIERRSDVNGFEDRVFELARQTHVRRIDAYRRLDTRSLLTNILQIRDALDFLSEADHALLISGSGEQIRFNPTISLAAESVDEILVERKVTNTEDLILRIKKPDFLGNSMWEFHHERSLDARVTDELWLSKFKMREEPLLPGDSLFAKVQVVRKYDNSGNIVGQEYTVLKVYRVIKSAEAQQDALFTQQ